MLVPLTSSLTFVSKVSAAFRLGTPVDDVPSLSTFLMEMEMYKRLGLRREDLLNRPAQEIKDYSFFISMMQREESARQAQQNNGGSAPMSRG